MEVYARANWHMSDGNNDYLFEIDPSSGEKSVSEYLGNENPDFPYVYTIDDDEEKMSHAAFIAKYGDWRYVDISWSGAT